MRYPLLILSLLLLSCGGNDGDLTAPDIGSLEIRTSTTGEAGADYMIAVDGASGRTLAPNGSLTVSDLEPGFHTVEILAPPPGCTVAGDTPRTVSVAAGSTSMVTFVINCVPLLGSIQVTTTTAAPGPAIYKLVMEGTSIAPIGSSASRSIGNVPPGSHTINLGNIPATCQVQGTSSQTVTVEPSSSAAVTFAINCAPTPGGAGTLEITVSTSGPDADPDGYEAVVDGGTPQPIGINATLTLTSLAAGNHTVRLDGVAANCSVAGPNSQTVTVPANGSASVTFAVTCTEAQPTTGTLRITTTTSGSDVDPDGYLVEVNDREPVEMDADDELSLDLEAGTYTVTLSGVAENCTVSEAEQTTEVTAGSTQEIEFDITCAASQPTTGTLRITTATAGTEVDSDGYLVTINDREPVEMDADDELSLDLEPGTYTVTLSGVAENCTVSEAEQTAEVTAGTTEEVEFDITCSEPTGSIRVELTTEGTPDDEEGFAVTLDGGEPQTFPFDEGVTLEDVNVGEHELVLEVASNCTVAGSETQPVDVSAGETTVVSYDVDCSGTSTARR
jgi:hypothetical protein